MMVDMSDLIYYAAQQQPADFESAFRDIMVDKIATAIDNKKIEVAHAMFNSSNDVEDTEELEDQEDGKTTQ